MDKLDYHSGKVMSLFHHDDTRIRGVRGPFRTGKSVSCVAEGMYRARMQAPSKSGIRDTKWLVVRNTYGQLADTTIETFLKWIPDGGFGRFVKTPYPNYYMDFLDEYGGRVRCQVRFRALDRPDHLRNLLSQEYTFFWANEARELSRDFIDWLESRAGQYPPRVDMPNTHIGPWPTWYGGWMDTNPPDDNVPGDPHWWYRLFEEQCKLGSDEYDPRIAAKYKEFVCDKTENIRNLPERYYEELAIGKPAEWVSVYIEGNYGFIVGGKVVYPEWKDEYHCRKENYEPVPGIPIARAWDAGNTIHPAVSFGQLNQGLEVFDEIVFNNVGIHRMKQLVIEYCAEHYAGFDFVDYGDPAMLSIAAGDKEERTCMEILAAAPHPINVLPGHISFTGRRTGVARLLGMSITDADGPAKPWFRLSPRCKVLRAGFNGRYCYPEIGDTGRFHDKPQKDKYADAHDSLQYMVTGMFAPTDEVDWKKKRKTAPPPRPPSAMAV